MTPLAFLGTPALAVPSLRALHRAGEVRLVVTRSAKGRGRGRKTSPTPVAAAAEELGLPVAEAEDAAAAEAALRAHPVRLAVTAGFGLLLPRTALEAPEAGMINVHFSLLPRWRGAAPVERAILAGDTVTGVSLMAMTEGLDAGPVFCSWETPIGPEETGGGLTERLAEGAARLLKDNLEGIVSGEATAAAQDETSATYAPRIKPEEARLDFRRPAAQLARAVRAFNPRPGASAVWRGTPGFKILTARLAESDLPALPPGRLAEAGERIMVGTGDRPLHLGIVQPPGKPPMPAAAWRRGVKGAPGQFE